MHRIDRITERLAMRLVAEGDEPLFSATFATAREKAKAYKQQLEEKARDDLKDALVKDLKSKGFEIVSVDLILGKYRGSRFVTSSKVRVVSKDIGQARGLVKFLRTYHPKFDLKNFDAEKKEAEYNIR